MNKKKILRVLSLALCLVLLVGVFSSCTKNPDSNAGGDTIKIGNIAPLTGEVSTYGIATTQGARLAVEEINASGGLLGKKIELIEHDDQGKAENATTGYGSLVKKNKIVALIGPVTSNPTNTVAGLANRDNLPMITPSGTAASITEGRKSVFRACFIDPFQGDLIADYASKKLGYKRAAVIFNSDDDYSKGLKDAFVATAGSLGMEVVATEAFQKGDINFSSQLTNIKNKSPDVIYLPVYYEDVAKIVAQASGISAKFLGGDGWDGATAQVSKDHIGLIEGAFYCSQYSPQSDNPKVASFLKEYKAKYSKDANQFSVLGYDAAMMLFQAIEKAGSTDSSKVIEAMEKIDYNGLTGNIKFDEKHNPIKQAAIIEIVGGNDVFKEFYAK